MPQTTTITLPAGEFVLLTDADVSALTFQNVDPDDLWLIGSVDETEPTSLEGALLVEHGDGGRNLALADLWPGSAFVRVFAYSEPGGRVMVSHA